MKEGRKEGKIEEDGWLEKEKKSRKGKFKE